VRAVFTPDRSCLLVGWPRTGSTVLADAMTATGVLGRVHEYFWRLLEPGHASELGLPTPTDETYASYMDAVLRHGTTDNGVFGAKLFWVHAVDLVRRTGLFPDLAGLDAIKRLWAPFGDDIRLVYIRRNCLRSALSLWRAEVTNEWGRAPGAEAPDPPEAADLWLISQFHAEIHAAEIGWDAVLAASRRPVLRLTYDEISSDLACALSEVAAFGGVGIPTGFELVPAYERQADDATDRFRRAWTDATGGCQACDTGPLTL
jgi:LPS sulfotransferase NodH